MARALSKTLALSNPTWFTSPKPAPEFRSSRVVFKSRRATDAVSAMAALKAAKPVKKRASAKPQPKSQHVYKTASHDTWYDEKTDFEVFLDWFWSRRNAAGELRSRKSYHTAMKWQAFASFSLFPPVGGLMVLFNMCFGLRPRATRLSFIASLTLAALMASNAMFASDPIVLAALR